METGRKEERENIIKIQGLTKYYGKQKGVENLDLEVKKGEIFGFIGPNGAGKSTTIRTILGLLTPTAGTIEVFGEKVRGNHTELLRRIGYMPSEASFYSRMRAGEAIRFSAALYGQDCREEAGRLCERLKLDVRKKVSELSLGNRKKVSMVCAFQHKAELYILDEPTSGLDPLMQREFFEILKEKNREGASVFLSSHILNEIQRYCHRAAMIRDGRLLLEDQVGNLCRRKARRVSVQGVREIPGLEGIKLEETPEGVSFLYQGEARELILALQGLPIQDITITEPDLEETFLHFYQGGETR